MVPSAYPVKGPAPSKEPWLCALTADAHVIVGVEHLHLPLGGVRRQARVALALIDSREGASLPAALARPLVSKFWRMVFEALPQRRKPRALLLSCNFGANLVHCYSEKRSWSRTHIAVANMADSQANRPHRPGKEKKAHSGGPNPKAFAFNAPGRLARQGARSGDVCAASGLVTSLY